MIRKYVLMAGVSAFALVMGAEMASAQELDVTKRPRPEYDAVGVRAGSFLVFPELTLKETYNDNIFAETNNEVSDYITRVRPAVKIKSDWNNHSLRIDAFLESGLYADHSSEDYNDYGISADGRLDVQRDANIFAGGNAAHLNEERGSPDDTRGTDPTEYDRYDANLGGLYKPNRLGVTVEGAWRHLDYSDVTTSLGTIVNNDDRDRNVYTERLRVGYDVQPGYTAFVQGSLNQREYDNRPDDNGFNRNSEGWRVDTGLEIRLTGTMDAEVFGGYFSQSYEDPAFTDASDVDAGGRLMWSINPLTTVQGSLVRDVVETTSVNASSYVSTDVNVRVDHELLRNVLVGGGIGYTNNDYNDINRQDDVWRLTADGKYLINRNFFAGAEVRYTDRSSNVPTTEYSQFTVGAFIGAQF